MRAEGAVAHAPQSCVYIDDCEQKRSTSREEDSVEDAPGNASADNGDGEWSCRGFGWRLHYDEKRNLAFYLHGYTGEVRWLHPESVGFVMEGTKPLPTGAVNEEAAAASPAAGSSARQAPRSKFESWNPNYPQVVMMPSGLIEVHPRVPDQGPTLCGYNRFPIAWNCGPGVVARSGVELETLQNTLKQSPGRRILPPTWEASVRERSPFLLPYPVAILGERSTGVRSCERGDEDVQQVCTSSEERRHGTAFRPQRDSSTCPESARRFLPQMAFVHPPPLPPFPVHLYQRLTEHSHFQPVDVLAKEHNRKGYTLRQNRKLNKEQGQRKTSHASQKTTTARCAQPNEKSRVTTKHYMQPNRIKLSEPPFRGKH